MSLSLGVCVHVCVCACVHLKMRDVLISWCVYGICIPLMSPCFNWPQISAGPLGAITHAHTDTHSCTHTFKVAEACTNIGIGLHVPAHTHTHTYTHTLKPRHSALMWPVSSLENIYVIHSQPIRVQGRASQL